MMILANGSKVLVLLVMPFSALTMTFAFSRNPTTPSRSFVPLMAFSPTTSTQQETGLFEAKSSLVEKLREGEDDNSEVLKPFLDILYKSYEASGIDARTSKDPCYNGDWSNINMPAFSTRIGFNEEGLPLYRIGDLTFGLFEAGKDIVCVVDRMVQHVHFCTDLPGRSLVPKSLADAFDKNPQSLRTNHIDTVFHVPASEGNPEVRGVLRMEGYTMPSADATNRYDTWFVRGHCFANPDADTRAFVDMFGSDASKLSYNLPKPITAYQTVVYLDNDLRVSIGNRGSLMINGCESVYA